MHIQINCCVWLCLWFIFRYELRKSTKSVVFGTGHKVWQSTPQYVSYTHILFKHYMSLALAWQYYMYSGSWLLQKALKGSGRESHNRQCGRHEDGWRRAEEGLCWFLLLLIILRYLAGHFESVQGDFWKCKSGSSPKPKWNQGPQIHKYTTEIQLRSTLSLKRQFLKIRWRSKKMECSRTKWTTRFGTGWM